MGLYCVYLPFFAVTAINSLPKKEPEIISAKDSRCSLVNSDFPPSGRIIVTVKI